MCPLAALPPFTLPFPRRISPWPPSCRFDPPFAPHNVLPAATVIYFLNAECAPLQAIGFVQIGQYNVQSNFNQQIANQPPYQWPHSCSLLVLLAALLLRLLAAEGLQRVLQGLHLKVPGDDAAPQRPPAAQQGAAGTAGRQADEEQWRDRARAQAGLAKCKRVR